MCIKNLLCVISAELETQQGTKQNFLSSMSSCSSGERKIMHTINVCVCVCRGEGRGCEKCSVLGRAVMKQGVMIKRLAEEWEF